MQFPDTRWSHVARSRGREPQAQTALSDLCADYYEPVFVFLRSEGRSEDDARELTQEFFARLLGGNGVDGAEQERGKFRTFVLGAVKHFLAARREYEMREKRGGGLTPEPLDPGTASAPGLDPADALTLPPDAAFDRQWALTVLDRTLAALEAEMQGRAEVFAALTPFLTGGADYGHIESTAPALRMTPAALRVAIHRLRHRYRDLLRAELAQTLAPGASVDDELAALKSALRAG
jgi:DNA-directed RNA polymerase specialized sigma24 family protein